MKIRDRSHSQRGLFACLSTKPRPSRFITTYRVAWLGTETSLQEMPSVGLPAGPVQPIVKNLILTCGQSDREQFCLGLLNTKNEITVLNIVSTGTVSLAPFCPREVLNPAILANASTLILAHNHLSGDPQSTPEDLSLTEKLIQACHLVGTQVHEP